MCDWARMLFKCKYQKATPEMSDNRHSGVLTFKQPTFAYVNTEYIAVISVFTVWRHMLQGMKICFFVFVSACTVNC